MTTVNNSIVLCTFRVFNVRVHGNGDDAKVPWKRSHASFFEEKCLYLKASPTERYNSTH
jgi:uncharacterized protein YhfF